VSRRALAHLRRADPVLAKVIDRVGPYRFKPARVGTHFDAVVRAICYQQLNGKAAATIYERLCGLWGHPPTPRELLRVSEEKLRGVGLSRQKLGYMKDLAARCASGEVPIDDLDDLDDAGIVGALTRVKGVGVWTAHMFLFIRLGRPDVLPSLDFGIRSAIKKWWRLKTMPSPRRVEEIGKAWSPYASVASWYLWRSLDD
jgi:3-methyladenine DNA glycosylase/8-oxoguanine DNA glycosylase